jgi:hypothetical protein
MFYTDSWERRRRAAADYSQCTSVSAVLAELGLLHYAPLFEREEITLDMLLGFDEAQLELVGVPCTSLVVATNHDGITRCRLMSLSA